MALFKKKERPQEPEMEVKAAAAGLTDQENKKQSDSEICYSRLEAQFLMEYQGVVLKLYIENFKRMNDLFGHERCERLLEQILAYLEQKSGCAVYRYIGVEFIVIMKNRTMGEATRLADQLIERFDESWAVDGVECLCSVQIGLCSYPGYANNASDMMKCLDLAVARAAELGSNQYIAYDMDLHKRFLRRQAIARYLGTALANNEVEVRYRPTYDTETGKFTRAEFYMRIFIQDIGMVGSIEFLPVAEDTGQIRQVEYYALDKAAAMVAKLLEEGKEFDSIAIPISPTLLMQGDFVQQVGQVIEKYKLPQGKLAIEVDEYMVGVDYANIAGRLQALSWLGVELILNNFGSGSSGLMKIFELPVDTLKFNRMFVWEIENTSKCEPVVEGLVRIALNMNKELIAEGVETNKQKKFLEKCGCTLQQGFYYAPTMPEKQLPSLIGTSLESARSMVEQEKKELKR